MRPDVAEKLGFRHLAHAIHKIKLPPAEGLQDILLIVLEDDNIHPLQGSLRRDSSSWSINEVIVL